MKTLTSLGTPGERQPASAPRAEVTFPLTREQEGLWIEWKLSPMGVSYNTCIQMKLQGPLDTDRFGRAIADVVSQFELLRAYCVETDGRPCFRLSNAPYEIEIIDIAAGDALESEAAHNKAMGLLTRRRDAAIDLTKFPLIRSALIKTAAETYYFIGVVPHIISDGYSAVFVLKAISIAYEQGPDGLSGAYGEGRKDWRDYLARRAERSSQAHAEAVEHWQRTLAGAQHIMPICGPLDAAGSLADSAGRRHFFSLDADKVQRFTRLARARKTSLFSILAALFASLLYRQTGQRDLVLVFPINSRPAGFRDAFGFFVNMIPLRVDMSGNPSFTELVDQIGARRRLDKKHQHLPGLDIVKAKRESTPGFDGRLCNVSMAQTVSRFQGLEIPGIQCTALDNDLIHVRDDLSLMYEVSADLIGLWLEYRASSIDDADVRSMAGHFGRLASAVDENPEARIAEIDLLSADARQAILALGRGAPLPAPQSAYGDLFRRALDAHPDQVALRYHEQALSYRQLGERSHALAAVLARAAGCVVVLMERSPAQIVAMLAALRAGVAFVPLDPDQGRARLDKILDEVKPDHLICAPETLTKLAPKWRRLHLRVDAPHASRPAPLARVDGAAAAYIIYTSGSTGRPKGVQVSHAALTQRICWLVSEFALTPGEAVLQNTNHAFDVSVAEIFWPLAMGATLVLSDPGLVRDPRYLRQLIADEGVTTACMVASALQMLLPEPAEAGQLHTLKRVLCAGEALSIGLARQVYRLTQARLFNIYGPTEATIYATCKEIDPRDEFISIGKPIANTAVAVVNDALRLQPPGIEGELCLSGPGLADGYVAQPTLTAAQFPHDAIDGGRWYRTGDRARLLGNGEIEYLGRADGQIKLRGYRIELGEIEHVLRVQRQVQDAAVVARDGDAAGANKTLAAFVAAGSTFAATASSPQHPLHALNWRATLAAQLPGYMIPNTLVWVAALPRLASGKLDHAALPSLIARRADADKPPVTDDEKALARVWADVLGLPLQNIGLHSNFFELGGDSLMLIGVATKAEEAGLYIDVHELFEHASIAQALPLARKTPRQLINQAPVQGTYPALPRHVKFFTDGFVHPHHWNRTFLLRFNRHIDTAALQQSLAAAVRHHDGLRITFHAAGDSHVFTNHGPAAATPSIETIDLTPMPPQNRQSHVLAKLNEANANLRLDEPLLLRVMLFEDERASTLALVLHHLLIDMRSCQILLEDLLSGYQASISHRPVRLPPKTTSLGEWSERLSRLVDENWQAAELEFWSAQLAHAGHPLPRDRPPASKATEAQQRAVETGLAVHHTDLLTRHLAPALNMGVHEILLASFAAVFKGWSGASHLVVNTCGVGRDNLIDGVNLTRTVGELNTVFPLAIDLRPADTLQTVRTCYRMLPANGLHYGMLRYLGGHAELARPEPDIFFNYVSRVDLSAEKSLGVSVEMAPAGVRSSHPDNRACYALYLEAFIQHGNLLLHVGYDASSFSEASMQRLAKAWADNLTNLLEEKPAIDR